MVTTSRLVQVLFILINWNLGLFILFILIYPYVQDFPWKLIK